MVEAMFPMMVIIVKMIVELFERGLMHILMLARAKFST
jgi:hypothetical protein